MDKQPLSPREMLTIGTEHALCAEHLLQGNAEIVADQQPSIDTLLPVVSLLHLAFELTLKSYLLVQQHNIGQYKSLQELLDQQTHLGLSLQETDLIQSLSRQFAFHKGKTYSLHSDRQQLHVFCLKVSDLYTRLLDLMPLELHKDYQAL